MEQAQNLNVLTAWKGTLVIHLVYLTQLLIVRVDSFVQEQLFNHGLVQMVECVFQVKYAREDLPLLYHALLENTAKTTLHQAHRVVVKQVITVLQAVKSRIQ